ncbi:MAG TPA: hypothetical protein PLE19_21545 [Planctomycetota bacterium]|mgnify:CR=1 FL=1|nr:hypothetical protein [Planctomycetota bacterium]HRR82219.1 hypothetical protein [Planctomycetota bacterium]HRT96256.1 hypothetical protein [Planctomycetota bacterium]
MRTLSAVLLGALISAAVLAEEPAAPDAARYQPRDPASLTVPRKPVTRKDYVDAVRPMAQGFEAGPDRGTYGPRHALGALAVYALEGNPKLAEGIKKTLRHYADWVKQCVEKEKGVFSMEGAALCSFYFRELRKRGAMTPDDEQWAKELLLTLRQWQCAWRPGDGLWRGSQHRSQCQGLNHAFAATFYPDEPDAPKWRAYADAVWGDWWNFRDVGIDDTGYFHSSWGNILRSSELLGRKEVFRDRRARELFDRLVAETPPDGAVIPYGASGGYNSAAGARILALELAAKWTRDGRYRWVAHRLFNHGQARGFSPTHHHLNAVNLEDIALTGLICDDSVKLVEPSAASALLTRKEILRLTDKEAKAMFPEAGGIDCNMWMSQRVLPSKLAFRSGWAPGDLFMLVEIYPRHDPLNPTAIVGLERHSASFAEMTSEKFVSRENAVAIADLSGTATYLGKKPFKGKPGLPLGWAGMEVTVPAFSDHALASHARVQVSKYMGFEATHTREFLFVKNRFVVLRDETAFDDAFRASVGPAWNTQHVGEPRGPNWLNTWFDGHYFQASRLYDVPPWDLLLVYGPKPGAKIEVATEPIDAPAKSHLVATRYAWEGDVTPGQRVQFVSVLLPHAPMRDATPLARGVEVLKDEPGLAVVKVATEGRVELTLLNPSGARVEVDTKGLGPLVTDARAAYLDTEGGNVKRAVVIEGRSLKLGEVRIGRGWWRRTYERGG